MTSTHHNTSERFSASLTEDGRYRLLVEAVTDYAIYMLDKEGIVSSWNAGAQRFTGYEATEIIGKHFSQFYTEEDRRTACRSGVSILRHARVSLRVKNGASVKTAHAFGRMSSSESDPDSDGTLVGYAKITRDLTERRDAKDLLRRTEKQFKLLVESVTDYAIFMLTPDGHVATWNKGAQRIRGYYRQTFFRVLHVRGSGSRGSAGFPRGRCPCRTIRERRLARPQGRRKILSKRRHRRD